jgi:pimeloyl-ACP methyl ester carboxylesterase
MNTPAHPLGFVLIHGGGLEHWVWDRLTPLLDLPAVAVQRLPPQANRNRLTIHDCAHFIQKQADAAGVERTILVAHSIAGVLAPAIVRLAPERVAHMVFLAANIPPEGLTALSAFRGAERFSVMLGTVLSAWNIMPRRAMEQHIRERLCNDLDEATTEQMITGGQHPEPRALFFEQVSRAGLPPIPCTYIKLLHDQALLPDVQDRMAATIGAQVETLDSGHTAMLSQPGQLAALLNRVAATVSAPTAQTTVDRR